MKYSLLSGCILVSLKLTTALMVSENVCNYNMDCLVVLREVSVCGIYFGSYDAIRQQDHSVLISGTISDTVSWLFTYPLDIVNTHIQ